MADLDFASVEQALASHARTVDFWRRDHPVATVGQELEGRLAEANAVFEIGGARVGIVICAEGGPDFTWDDLASAGAQVALFCAASAGKRSFAISSRCARSPNGSGSTAVCWRV